MSLRLLADHRLRAGQLLWVLVVLSAAGCKSRTITCDRPTYFRRLPGPEGARATSFAALAKGPAVSQRDLQTVVEDITFFDTTHVGIRFMTHDFGVADEYIFSPAEEKVRLKKAPHVALPIVRLADGSPGGSVRLGFRSAPCIRSEQGSPACQGYGDEIDLIAELACRVDPAWRWR